MHLAVVAHLKENITMSFSFCQRLHITNTEPEDSDAAETEENDSPAHDSTEPQSVIVLEVRR